MLTPRNSTSYQAISAGLAPAGSQLTSYAPTTKATHRALRPARPGGSNDLRAPADNKKRCRAPDRVRCTTPLSNTLPHPSGGSGDSQAITSLASERLAVELELVQELASGLLELAWGPEQGPESCWLAQASSCLVDSSRHCHRRFRSRLAPGCSNCPRRQESHSRNGRSIGIRRRDADHNRRSCRSHYSHRSTRTRHIHRSRLHS